MSDKEKGNLPEKKTSIKENASRISKTVVSIVLAIVVLLVLVAVLGWNIFTGTMKLICDDIKSYIICALIGAAVTYILCASIFHLSSKKNPKNTGGVEKKKNHGLQPTPDEIKEIKEAYEYQKKSGWTFNDDRELMETTFHNRFNFILLAYSLFITAYFGTNDINDRLTVLAIGFIILFLMTIGNYKAYTRFNTLFEILHYLDDKDVVPFFKKFRSNSKHKKNGLYRLFSRASLFGYIIPVIMVISLFIEIIINIIKYCKTK